MQKTSILITGANGEMGRGLISTLSKGNNFSIIALDLNQIDSSISNLCSETIIGDILDDSLVNKLNNNLHLVNKSLFRHCIIIRVYG